MKYIFSCPSKTFLLGEYLVLNNGSALLMSTEPRFELLANTKGEGFVTGIEPESPAGQWLRQNNLIFSTVDIEFLDPHHRHGGFGASSAQYLLTHWLTHILKHKKQDVSLEGIWRSYRQLETVSSEGLRPSGADVVSQFVGRFCEVQIEPFGYKKFEWPFVDECVILAHTGHKLATHEHLRGLKRVQTDELEWIYSRAIEMFSIKHSQGFFESINDYYAELLELGLVAENTQVLIASLLSLPYVRAAKGCGAMGNDVVAVFVSVESKALALEAIRKLGLNVVADSTQLSFGAEFKSNEDPAVIEKGP